MLSWSPKAKYSCVNFSPASVPILRMAVGRHGVSAWPPVICADKSRSRGMGSPDIDEGRIIFESARRENMNVMPGVRVIPPAVSGFVSEIGLEKP